MADLIDRQALLAEINTQRESARTSYPRLHFVIGDALRCIYDAPTVDAVEVCRCKNCEWGGKCEVECLLREVDKIPDPYCAAGKRRADDATD